ncbi:ATP phosphoribosyltransferase regulatory subunit [Sediminicurvatus halobius]|uniref:ATP phosphoribosyltransferase regulatory subunit n=1 Tax=Sediminicurvatus halobius TaxID=2182432 RepID=A0A2U2N0V8_9GAMM|nr:ATP phosphoribosyltransferase regulatory subunit [Spiribacter halobius]PWG62885.1 ATP phosphoribosyltransferase regulatory subunit [Spiribacter halobius]UEX76964.1 ATP phosphoribosyltransferase regulatory subunit [Spiribacter halobius]
MSQPYDGRNDPWLLPDAVEELLPPAARGLEQLRQQVLATCERWGYELVMPPAIEYLESLLTGVAHDLDLQTFKLTDQLTGRLMGVRADITPQAARIDAHQLRRDCPVRLCYTGTVLQTRPDGPTGSRNPLQMGAELYGHAGIESDVEIIALMLEILTTAGAQDVHLDLGHVGIFRGLAAEAGLDDEAEIRLWDALQRKATAEIETLLGELEMPEAVRRRLAALPGLAGGVEVLEHANGELAGAAAPVREALQALWSVASALERWLPSVPLHFDLGELRGYRYHTGVVFAAYVPGHSAELARGGRYDDIGRVFGRARPATGFSTDLKALHRLAAAEAAPQPAAIGAPWRGDAALLARVRALRAEGERVIWLLPGHEQEAVAMGCDRVLRADGSGHWRIEPIE